MSGLYIIGTKRFGNWQIVIANGAKNCNILNHYFFKDKEWHPILTLIISSDSSSRRKDVSGLYYNHLRNSTLDIIFLGKKIKFIVYAICMPIKDANGPTHLVLFDNKPSRCIVNENTRFAWSQGPEPDIKQRPKSIKSPAWNLMLNKIRWVGPLYVIYVNFMASNYLYLINLSCKNA